MYCPNCHSELLDVVTGTAVGGEADERWDDEWIECENCGGRFSPEDLEEEYEDRNIE